MEKQTVFGIAALALVTGIVIGGWISTIRGEIYYQEVLQKTLLSNNLAWYDPNSGEFIVLKLKPMQHFVIPKEVMDSEVNSRLDKSE